MSVVAPIHWPKVVLNANNKLKKMQTKQVNNNNTNRSKMQQSHGTKSSSFPVCHAKIEASQRCENYRPSWKAAHKFSFLQRNKRPLAQYTRRPILSAKRSSSSIISLILFALVASSVHKIGTAQEELLSRLEAAVPQTSASAPAAISEPNGHLHAEFSSASSDAPLLGAGLKENEDFRPDNVASDRIDEAAADEANDKAAKQTGRQQQFRALSGRNNWPRNTVNKLHKLKRNNSTNSSTDRTKLAIGDIKLLPRRVSSSVAYEKGEPVSSSELPKATSKKINSAVLKKLLQQTLPRSMNATTTSGSGGFSAAGQKASNFKFVFIQRATTAPSIRGSKNLGPIVLSSSSDVKADKIPSVVVQGTKPSLAEAIAKQLTSSLLYSAANMVGNLTSMPSLSVSLASQSSRSSALHSTTEASSVDSLSSKQTESTTSRPKDQAGNLESNEIRRFGQSIAKVTHISSADKGSQQQQYAAGQRFKNRPSKIYKLPLKFVANGQPNSIVLHTLKQHFLMIKRIQAAAGATKNTSSSADSAGRFGTKKTNNVKSKGNSRLIYLPLKYISNAKPNMLQAIATRVSHKSGSNHRH